MNETCDGLRPRLFAAEVVENRPLAANGFLLSVLARGIDVRLAPGQFVQARAWESDDPLLRRPLSPLDARATPEGTRLDFLMTAVGRGTRLFQVRRPGDPATFLGPLGRGFSTLPPGRAVLVAGGVGLAPIRHLAREAVEAGRAGDIHVIVGAREKKLLFAVEEVRALGVSLEIATDRGDEGFHGNAVQAFEAALARGGERPAIVCGCGPERMLESLVKVTKREGLRCEVSLERRMACGFGVCFTCVCRAVDEKTGHLKNVRTCLDGPVIDAARLPDDAW